MLEMRPTCECCHQSLEPEAQNALICSFECTFCAACNDAHLQDKCPNCGGALTARPTRAPALLKKFPASQTKVESAKLKAMYHGKD
ncbi:MAG: DUF1272 domain-containing protein [Alphaproteobacteria bacterium]